MSNSFKAGDGKMYNWIDADTFVGEDNQRYRVNGYDAREAAKLTKEGVDPGEIGQEKQAQAIADIQNDGGYFNIVDSGEKDDYGRRLINLQDSNNKDFSETLFQSGAVEVDEYTSDAHLRAKDEGNLERELLGGKPSVELSDYLHERQRPISHELGGGIFKKTAIDEREFDADRHSDVAFRDYDRTLENEAKSSTSAAWEAGWNNVKGGLFGAAELIGNGIGYEGMERYGAIGVADIARDTADIPTFIQDYKQITKGSKSTSDSIVKGFEYVLNNAVMSAPYMAMLLGGIPFGAAGAVAGTGALGLTHAGNVWNDIEGPKGGREAVASLTAALAMVTLERVGLSAIMKPSAFLSANGIKIAEKKLAEKMARKAGLSVATETMEASARAQIGQALTSNSSGMLRQLATVSAEDITKLGFAREAAKQGARGFAGEATTEGLQEAVQYTTSTGLSEGGWERHFNTDDFSNGIINGILAGGSIGGSIGSVGGVRRAHESRIFQSDVEKGNVDKLNRMERLRQNHLSNGEYINTVEENLYDTRRAREAAEVSDPDTGKVASETSGRTANLAKKFQDEKRGIKNVLSAIDDIPDAVSVAFSGIQKLYQGAEKQAVPIEKAEQSPILRDILGRIGQNAYSVYHSGQNFVNRQDNIMGEIKSNIDEERIMKRLGIKGTKKWSSKSYRDMSKNLKILGGSPAFAELKLMSKQQSDMDNVRTLLPKELQSKTDEEIVALFASGIEFEKAYDEIFNIYAKEHEKSTGSKLPVSEGYWTRQAEFSARKVKADPDGFKNFMRRQKQLRLNDKQIDEMYKNIVYGGNLDNLDNDADFSYLNGSEVTPTSFKPEHEQLSSAEGFEAFAEDDMFAVLDKRAREASRYKSTKEYFGPGGKDLDYLFDQLAQEGVLSEDEIARTAWYTKAIIDSTHGNFNVIQNDNVRAAMQFLTTWSTFSGLGLAALSSVPETAMITFGLRDNQQVRDSVDHLMDEAKAMMMGAQSDAKQKLDRIGLKTDRISVASRLASGKINPAYLVWQDRFFNATQIKTITDFQRRANAAMSIDFMADNLDMLNDVELNEDGSVDVGSMNQFQLDSYNQLSNLGIQVDKMLGYWRDADIGVRQSLLDTNESARSVRQLQGDGGHASFLNSPSGREEAFRGLIQGKGAGSEDIVAKSNEIREFFDSQIDTATYRFVNERVQNPQSANRPLFFQDPRYVLLTQFNGFLSTYTSVVFPKLWNDTIKNGAPRARYQAAQMALAMIVLGGASQWLKDILKYGEPSPHLDNWGYAQRALASSGILGQAEKAVEIVAPLYPSRNESSVDRLIQLATGRESPALRNVTGVLEGVTNLARGDTERGVNQITRTVPVTSNLPGVRGAVNDLLQGRTPQFGDE